MPLLRVEVMVRGCGFRARAIHVGA